MSDLATFQQLFYDMFVTYSLGSPLIAIIVVFGMIYAFMTLKGFGQTTTIFILTFAGVTIGIMTFGITFGFIFAAIVGIIILLFILSIFYK